MSPTPPSRSAQTARPTSWIPTRSMRGATAPLYGARPGGGHRRPALRRAFFRPFTQQDRAKTPEVSILHPSRAAAGDKRQKRRPRHPAPFSQPPDLARPPIAHAARVLISVVRRATPSPLLIRGAPTANAVTSIHTPVRNRTGRRATRNPAVLGPSPKQSPATCVGTFRFAPAPTTGDQTSASLRRTALLRRVKPALIEKGDRIFARSKRSRTLSRSTGTGTSMAPPAPGSSERRRAKRDQRCGRRPRPRPRRHGAL